MNKNLVILFVFLQLGYSLVAQGTDTTFVQSDTLLSSFIQDPTVIWADLNNDTNLDFIAAGTKPNGESYLAIYENQTDGQFREILDSLPALKGVQVAIADYNHDTWLDVFLMGLDQNGQLVSGLWLNQTNFKFGQTSTTFKTLTKADVLAADFDQNGTADLVLSGESEQGERQLVFYKNDRVDMELFVPDSLPKLTFAQLAQIDYNRDLRQDILLTGLDTSGAIVNVLLKNEGEFKFTALDFTDEPLYNGATSVGDVDHNGYPDFAISGIDENGSYQTVIYQNKVNSTFEKTTLSTGLANNLLIADLDKDGLADVFFSGIDEHSQTKAIIYNDVADGTIDLGYVAIDTLLPSFAFSSLGDYDNDGDLDVLLLNTEQADITSGLYRNNFDGDNYPPVPPASETAIAVAIHGKTFFTWGAATDDHTATNALTYAIFIGKDGRNTEWTSPFFELGKGHRKMPLHGNVGHERSYILDELIDGRTEWGVQGVDNSLASLSGDHVSGVCEGNILFKCLDISLREVSVCSSQRVDLSTGTGAGLWFSTSKGYLGTFESVNYLATEADTVFYVVPNNGECDEAVSWAIEVIEDEEEFNPFEDMTVCPREVLDLELDGNYTEISWASQKKGALNGTAIEWTAEETDRLWVSVSKENGCPSSDTFQINVIDLSHITVCEDKTITQGEHVQLCADGGENATYEWFPDESLDNSSIADPIATPDETTTYYVTIVTDEGCQQIENLTVTVESIPTIAFIPNLFSPNQDGNNDLFKVYGLTDVKTIDFKVFDRQGNLVFEATSLSELQQGWDGKKGGKEMPNGTYFWILNGSDGNDHPILIDNKSSGYVQLLK